MMNETLFAMFNGGEKQISVKSTGLCDDDFGYPYSLSFSMRVGLVPAPTTHDLTNGCTV